MEKAEKITTGEIIPRDYGIIIERENKKLFITPMNHIIGELILATPQEISQKLAKKAGQLKIRPNTLKKELAEAVKKREGTDNILRYGGRKALHWVRNYNTIAGKVISKSRPEICGVQISYLENAKPGELNYASIGSDNPNEFWAKVKSKNRNLEIMIDQAAALDLAIHKDNKQRKSAKNNLTRLFPRQRPETAMPFNIADPLEIIIEYYIEGRKRFELNKELLAKTENYTPELLQTFQNHPDNVYFSVIRQAEKEVQKTHPDRQYFGAVKALEKRIIQELKSKIFVWDQYGLEFRETQNETVSKRYRKGDQVYSICTQAGQPPLIVHKKLGEKAKNWITAKEARTDNPYKRTEIYTSTDDTTRRQAWTQIITPGKGNNIFVPEILKKEYGRIA